MQFIDTHIHLQDDKSNNATDIINGAVQQGCRKMICVSAVEEDWLKIIQILEKEGDKIVPAFGIHPWYVTDTTGGWQTRLQDILRHYPQALIGECGLDGLKPNSELQKSVFREQIDMACQYQRPMVIHAVKAVSLMDGLWQKLPEKFVFHSFNGKKEFLQMIIQAGGYVGIGGSLLKTPKAKELLPLIPADKMLFETDAPFQAKDSGQILSYLAMAAKILNRDLKSFAEQIYNNSEAFIMVKKR